MDVEEELPMIPERKQDPYPASQPMVVIVQFAPLLIHPLGIVPLSKVILVIRTIDNDIGTEILPEELVAVIE
jgi:hypothetical protein